MAELYTTQSPFIDKDADQADLERKNKIDLATINAVSKAMGSAGAASDPFSGTAPAAPAAGSSAPTPQQMGVTATPAAAAAPAPAASPFDAFTKLLNDTDPSLAALRQKSIAGAQQQLDNPAAAFDQGAAISREDLGRTIQSARESQREDLIKTYGANASQVMPQMENFDQAAILESRDLNRRLTADRATAVNQGTTQAIANAMGILGQQSQDQLGKAGLGLSAAQSTEQSRQFEKSVAVQQSEAALGRKFTTDERTALQAYQTAERQGAEGFAAAEAAIGRKFTSDERAAIQEYQTQERLGSQSYASAENALGRTFTTTEREAIQAFQRAEREGSQGFEAAEAALGRKFTSSEREAIQAYQTSERESSQVFTAAENDLGRKFTSAERLAVQDWQKAEREGAQDFAAAEAVLGRKFTSEEREAIQTYQTSERLSSQDFAAIQTEKGYVHDNQIEIMRSNLQKELQATGISADQAKQQADIKAQELYQQRDQEYNTLQQDLTRKWNTTERIDTQNWQKGIQAAEFRQQDSLAKLQDLTQRAIAQGNWDNASKLQAEQLLSQAAESEKQRSANYLMFAAEQAQQDDQFALEFGLRREDMKMKVQAFTEELKGMKLGNEYSQFQFDNEKVNKAIESAVYGLELMDEASPDAIQPFAERLATAMGESMGLDDADSALLQQAIASKFSTSTIGATPANQKEAYAAFDSILDSKGGFASPQAGETLKTYIKSLTSAYASATPGKMVSLGVGQGADFDAAARRLRDMGYTDQQRASLIKAERTGDSLFGTAGMKYTGTQAFADYAAFVKLIDSGLTEADAKSALSKLLGDTRSNAAIALETKK